MCPWFRLTDDFPCKQSSLVSRLLFHILSWPEMSFLFSLVIWEWYLFRLGSSSLSFRFPAFCLWNYFRLLILKKWMFFSINIPSAGRDMQKKQNYTNLWPTKLWTRIIVHRILRFCAFFSKTFWGFVLFAPKHFEVFTKWYIFMFVIN